ncbi:MAG TPA: glycosyltransferase family A protein [Polyangiaceae bacterium]|nr:glycosyltransferase family A protein [Polyangiaceae bacterium]
MTTPLLSVTITNYNYVDFVGRAIESVLAQSFGDFELLIGDNASTDGSVDVIRNYALQDSRIRFVARPKNLGMAKNLSLTTADARGKFCVHLDADDWVIDPDAFKLQIDVLQQHARASAVYSPIVLCDERDTRVIIGPHDEDRVDPGEIAVREAMKVYIVNSGPMFRMSAYRNFGGYNQDYYHALDVKLAIDLCGQGDIAYINRPLYGFFQHESSVSHGSHFEPKQRDLVRAVESVFTGPLAPRLANPSAMRREALATVLTMHATLCVFNDSYRAGWRALYSGLRIMPLIVLRNKRIVALMARTALGAERYAMIQQLASPFRRKVHPYVRVVPRGESETPPASRRSSLRPPA